MRRFPVVLGLAYLFMLAAPVTALAGIAADTVCKEKKSKATGRKTLDVLTAFGRNGKIANLAKLTSDVSKAQSKFTKSFTKAEFTGTGDPRGCETTDDAGNVEAMVDPFVLDVVAALDPGIGSDFLVNTYTTDDQKVAGIAPYGAGGFVVVWQSLGSSGTDTSRESIQGQRFDSAGSPIGSQFQVNTYTTLQQLNPRVGPDGAGGFVVVWDTFGGGGTDTSFRSIQGQRYDSTGTPVGGEFQVNTTTTQRQEKPALGSDGAGGFVVVWESPYGSGSDGSLLGVHAQRFDSTGAPVGGEFQVNTYTTSNQEDAAVGADGAGGFVVVWESDGSGGTDVSGFSIHGQRYDGSGTPVGGEFQVNTYTTNWQRRPAIAADGTGGFVVVWESYGGGGMVISSINVHGQRYDGSGTPVGGEFQVNTYTTDGQVSTTIGSDGAGGLIVTWSSDGSSGTDQSDFSVQGQRYDSSGTPFSSQFQINTNTVGTQGGSTAGPDGAGGFWVVWSGDSDGSGDGGVWMRRVKGPVPIVIPATSYTGSLMLGFLIGLALARALRRSARQC